MSVVQDTSVIWAKVDPREGCTYHIMDSRAHTRRIWIEQRRALHPPVALPTLGLGEGGAADGVVSTERSQIHNFYYSNNYQQPLVQFVQLVSTLLLINASAWTWLRKMKNILDHTLKQAAVCLRRSAHISCELMPSHCMRITIKRTVIIEVISIDWWEDHQENLLQVHSCWNHPRM